MSLHRIASRNAGKGRRGGLGIGIVVVGLLVLAAFVPVRTCERCHGVAGFKIGEAIDLTCKGCGGKGKQTLLDIGISAIRK